MEIAKYTRRTRGKFGCTEERLWRTTFGLNEKGGMTDDEFFDFVMNSLVPS